MYDIDINKFEKKTNKTKNVYNSNNYWNWMKNNNHYWLYLKIWNFNSYPFNTKTYMKLLYLNVWSIISRNKR